MAFASLIISILALLIAGASALYTRRQARSAEEAGRLDKERRTEELTPGIDCAIERVSGWYRLTLSLTTTRPLTACHVRILSPSTSMAFTPSQDGVARANLQEANFGPLQPGIPSARRIDLGSGPIRVELQCRDADHSWALLRQVQGPHIRRH